MRFHPLTTEDARAISLWRYGGRFSLYDMMPEDEPELLRSEYRYHAGLDARGLLGFYCVGPDARVRSGRYPTGEPEVIDFGFGLRPDRVGQGLGRAFAAAALNHALTSAVAALSPATARVTIARFNLRSLSVFEGLGFTRTHRFRGEDGLDFVQLECAAETLKS